MNSFYVAFTLLKKNRFQTLAYLFVLTFTIVTTLAFFNIINNPELAKSSSGVLIYRDGQIVVEDPDYIFDLETENNLGSLYMLMASPIVIYALVMSYYINRLYFSRQTDNYAILRVCGASSKRLSRIMMIQFLSLYAVASVSGVLLAKLVVVPLMDKYTYMLLGIKNIPIGVIYSDSWFPTFSFYFALFVFTLMMNMSRLNGLGINSIMETGNLSFTIKKEKLFRYIDWFVYVILYVLGIVLYSLGKIGILVYTLTGAFASMGLLFECLPKAVSAIREKRFYANSKWFVASANLIYDMRKSLLISLLLSTGSIIFVSLIAGSKVGSGELLLSSVVLFVLEIMVNVGVVSQFVTEIPGKVSSYKSVLCLGFSHSDYCGIIFRETTVYFLMTLLVPGFYVAGATVINCINGTLMIRQAVLITVFYLIPIVISYGICLVSYISQINKEVSRTN